MEILQKDNMQPLSYVSCCSTLFGTHRKEQDLRDVIVQGQTIKFRVLKWSIRVFRTIHAYLYTSFSFKVGKIRLSFHIKVLFLLIYILISVKEVFLEQETT